MPRSFSQQSHFRQYKPLMQRIALASIAFPNLFLRLIMGVSFHPVYLDKAKKAKGRCAAIHHQRFLVGLELRAERLPYIWQIAVTTLCLLIIELLLRSYLPRSNPRANLNLPPSAERSSSASNSPCPPAMGQNYRSTLLDILQATHCIHQPPLHLSVQELQLIPA